MRDPIYITPQRSAILRRAMARFPCLDITAIELHVLLEHAAEVAKLRAFSPLERYGISRGRYYIMTHLSLEAMAGNEPPSPSAIADSLGVTRATVTQLLDGLERDGLVERRSVGHDRRAQAIHLTEAGTRLFDELVPLTSENIAEFWAPLSPQERQTLMDLLAKLGPQSAEAGGE